ncbi:hypothetical protein EON79_21105 [bacterium]|nr:MAG: hypothetical protein EON79_21105 [bacterium]
MEDITKLRRAARKNSLGFVAMPEHRRVFSSQAIDPSIYSQMLALPLAIAPPLQNEEGLLAFMWDFSPIDGEDPLS